MGRAELCVVALGGNAIIPHDRAGTIEDQRALAQATMAQVAAQTAQGVRVVLTHGNGPIIGNILLRCEAMAGKIPPMPLDVCGADSQGGIGYMIQQVLQNELARRGLPNPAVTIVTQVEVDPADPAFQYPTKPIGPFYTPREAAHLVATKGWQVRDDAGRGMRRMVPSPRPQRIVELPVIAALVEQGVIVTCCGGGGVPVVRHGDQLVGIEAVIDKDYTAVVLATHLHATRLDPPHWGRKGDARLRHRCCRPASQPDVGGSGVAAAGGRIPCWQYGTEDPRRPRLLARRRRRGRHHRSGAPVGGAGRRCRHAHRFGVRPDADARAGPASDGAAVARGPGLPAAGPFAKVPASLSSPWRFGCALLVGSCCSSSRSPSRAASAPRPRCPRTRASGSSSTSADAATSPSTIPPIAGLERARQELGIEVQYHRARRRDRS